MEKIDDLNNLTAEEREIFSAMQGQIFSYADWQGEIAGARFPVRRVFWVDVFSAYDQASVDPHMFGEQDNANQRIVVMLENMLLKGGAFDWQRLDREGKPSREEALATGEEYAAIFRRVYFRKWGVEPDEFDIRAHRNFALGLAD